MLMFDEINDNVYQKRQKKSFALVRNEENRLKCRDMISWQSWLKKLGGLKSYY